MGWGAVMTVWMPRAFSLEQFSLGSGQGVQCVFAALRVCARRSIWYLSCLCLCAVLWPSFPSESLPWRRVSWISPWNVCFPAVFLFASTFFPAWLYAALQRLVTRLVREVGAKHQKSCVRTSSSNGVYTRRMAERSSVEMFGGEVLPVHVIHLILWNQQVIKIRITGFTGLW